MVLHLSIFLHNYGMWFSINCFFAKYTMWFYINYLLVQILTILLHEILSRPSTNYGSLSTTFLQFAYRFLCTMNSMINLLFTALLHCNKFTLYCHPWCIIICWVLHEHNSSTEVYLKTRDGDICLYIKCLPM